MCKSLEIYFHIFSVWEIFQFWNRGLKKFRRDFFVKLNLIKIGYNLNSTDVVYYDYFEAIVDVDVTLGFMQNGTY